MNLNQITLPARDVEVTAAFYRELGCLQIVDSPGYARFESPEGDATFSLHKVPRLAEDTGVVLYFETDRLDELVAELEAVGIAFTQRPTDQRWRWREARLRDPSGNEICLYHAGEARRHPPWRVERRD